jgi:hypothetical protein
LSEQFAKNHSSMKQFSIKEYLEGRPLSWSAISSFEYDPEQWYRKYILNAPQHPSAEMEFGKVFAKSCEDRTPLAPVTMLSKMEQVFNTHFCDIPLNGYADTFDDVNFDQIGEYKTSRKMWTQEKVDAHGQIDMYILMNYQINKVRPEDTRLFLEAVLTEQTGNYEIRLKEPIHVFHFETRRTMTDLLRFGSRITRTVKEMEAYVRNHI